MAAGSLHSTQLLELSGIGPAALLQQLNITVALDLPGVGNNLQDHCLVGTFYPCTLSLRPTVRNEVDLPQTITPASRPLPISQLMRRTTP